MTTLTEKGDKVVVDNSTPLKTVSVVNENKLIIIKPSDKNVVVSVGKQGPPGLDNNNPYIIDNYSGGYPTTPGTSSLSIGQDVTTSNTGSVSIGATINNTGKNTTTIGVGLNNSDDYSVRIGVTSINGMHIKDEGQFHLIGDEACFVVPSYNHSSLFPSPSPTGALIVDSNQQLTMYDGSTWNSIGSETSALVQETTPSAGITGGLWYKPSTQELSIYESGQWNNQIVDAGYF
jgi:hypothetical protein